jgi:hypothetical protein
LRVTPLELHRYLSQEATPKRSLWLIVVKEGPNLDSIDELQAAAGPTSRGGESKGDELSSIFLGILTMLVLLVLLTGAEDSVDRMGRGSGEELDVVLGEGFHELLWEDRFLMSGSHERCDCDISHKWLPLMEVKPEVRAAPITMLLFVALVRLNLDASDKWFGKVGQSEDNSVMSPGDRSILDLVAAEEVEAIGGAESSSALACRE